MTEQKKISQHEKVSPPKKEWRKPVLTIRPVDETETGSGGFFESGTDFTDP